MPKKVKRKPKGAKVVRETCEGTTCIDPRTGRLIWVPSKSCPPGFVVKARRALRERGIIVRDPGDSVEREVVE